MRQPALFAASILRKLFAVAPLAVTLASCSALRAQVTPHVAPPSVQGTAVSDPAIPTIISPSVYGSQYFVLNQDLSLLTHSSLYTTYNHSCAAPTSLSATGTAPRTLLNDTQDVYVTAKSSSAANVAAVARSVGSSVCTDTPAFALGTTTPTQTLASNDPQHGRYFVLNSFATGSNVLTVLANLNAGGSSLTQQARVGLDSGAQYTSIVTDTRSTYGLTAVTELKTSTSPGNLWVYSPGIQTAFKILGPGGVPLPAVGSFIIPAQNDGGGSLLVLVNQDGLTASNLTSPPPDTTPFTIIDLGQLQRTFSSVVASGSTITLPFVTQIRASTPFYAMFGAAYNPVNHLVYALVGGGSSTSSIVENIISYDPTSPAAPNETVVADVTNIPLSFGSYPQLALNAAAGSMQILTSNPSAAYTAGITGTGNTAALIVGAPFPDSNLQPTFVAANPLLGETYIASQSGQIDIITRPATSSLQATLTINGPDNAVANQSYALPVVALYPVADPALLAAQVTITATPKTGAAFTFGSKTIGDVAYPGVTYYDGKFPSAGVYTLVATVPATASYPAITSNAITVTVGATTNTGVYPTTLSLSAPPNSSSNNVNATVTLSGGTYGPTGRIVVSDANGEVGRVTLAGGPVTFPVTVPVTLVTGTSTLTAVYNGDTQNQPATSPSITVKVGSSPTPALALTVPNGTAGATLQGNIAFNTTSTVVPTGNIVITAVASGSTTPITLATVSAASAFAGTNGVPFSFTAPAAGNYTASANYAGDANYAAAPPSSPSFVISPGTPQPPTASATATPNPALVGAAVTFSGSKSTDPNGKTLTYTWAFGDGTTGSGVSVTHAYATAGTYSATLTVTNTDALSSTASVSVVVNAAPTAALTLTGPSTAVGGTPVTFKLKLTTSGSTTAPVGSAFVSVQKAGGQQIPVGSVFISDLTASGGASVAITITLGAVVTPGVYVVTASYGNDPVYKAADVTANLTVAPATTSLALTGPATGTIGTPYPVLVVLNNASAAVTGTVVITATSSSGAKVTVSTPVSSAVTPGIIVPFSFNTADTYTIQAAYAGDFNDKASTSANITAVVSVPTGKAPTFTMTLDDPNVGDKAGAYFLGLVFPPYQSVTLTFKGYNNYSTPVTLTFTPTNVDPSFSNTRSRFRDTASGTIITSVTPTAAGTGVTLDMAFNPQLFPKQRSASAAFVYGGGFFCVTLFALARRSRKWSRALRLTSILWLAVIASSTLSGCFGSDPIIYAEYTVTATPAANAADQTTQSVHVWLSSKPTI